MFEHHTKTKGDLGVLKAKLDLFQKGFLILTPETEHAPFDLVAYKDKCFKRIQVKYREIVNGKVEIKGRTSWTDKSGTHERDYDLDSLDVFCVYIPSVDKCIYFDASLFKNIRTITFRVETPKNNQAKGIRRIADYCEVP